MVEKVMGKTRALIKYQGVMYKVVVQEILLYGSEIWVVPDEISRDDRRSEERRVVS